MPRTPTTRKTTAARAAGTAAAADAIAAIVTPPAGDATPPRYDELPIESITESPDNPRHLLPDLGGLAASIRAHGVIEPIIVTTDADRYRVVAGHRRLAAAQLAGLTRIPAIVRDSDAQHEMLARMVENLQREDLTPVEEARGYQRLKDLGLKQKEIADAVGRNQGHVSKRLTLLSLPESLQVRVGRPDDDGGITLEQAVEVGRLPGRVMVAIADATHAADDKKFAGGWQFDQIVAREARAAQRAGQIVEVVKALRAAKATVLNVDGDTIAPTPSYDRESGPAPLYWLRTVDKDEHAKLPCHALVLLSHPNGGGDDLVGQWTQAVCTDPASHAGDADPDDPNGPLVIGGRPMPADDPERVARNAALDEAATARHAFAVDLCHGKGVAVMRDYVMRGQIRDAVLGREYYLAAGDTANDLVTTAEAADLVELLTFGVTGTTDRLVRAALACRLDADLDATAKAVREAAAGRPGSWAPDVLDAIAFYEFARKAGYAPTEIELAALATITAEIPDPVRAALVEADLIEEDDEPAEVQDHDARRRALGVPDDAITRANLDGVPPAVWLEPARVVPTGRCATCRGACRALLTGAGRHAPGGGSVRKGADACPGHVLLTIDEVLADAPADQVDPVRCDTCDGIGRIGSAEDDLAKMPLCPDCQGAGVVAATAAADVAAVG